MRDVKRKVDAIGTLPELAEKPVISQEELHDHILYISLFGDANHVTLQQLADRVRTKLLTQSSIKKVEYKGRESREISVEINEATLQAYGLTLDSIASRINSESVSDSSGQLRTDLSTITLRSDDQAYRENEFKDIIVMTTDDGAVIRLGDIATVGDGYEENLVLNRYQGKPAITLELVTVGAEDVNATVRQAKTVLAELQESGEIPRQIKVVSWFDQSEYIRDRVSLLLNNGLTGMLLIVLVLALFLNFKIALRVSVGVPVAIAGTLALMSDTFLGYTINEMSTFGFIEVMGWTRPLKSSLAFSPGSA
ncbi:MAG: efflux RND transporter permease subunit [Pseudodesulfovibrio sp.]|nr:efflux RND transporter permease subunit [Pseudodesulfovibrio sp.]